MNTTSTNRQVSPASRLATTMMFCVLVWSGPAPVTVLGQPAEMNVTGPSVTYSSSPGVWTLRGLAGKCLDVGGYPTEPSSAVMLFDCNRTKAQHITFVPFGTPEAPYEYELRAHGRCLTVQGGIDEPDTPIVLTPCDNSESQRFYWNGTEIRTAIDPSGEYSHRRVAVRGANSANRTPLVLASTEPPAARRWDLLQVDTSPYDWAPVVATAGAYAFKAGFANKCIDVGGGRHPEHSPAFLYDCNGTLAQLFQLRPVNEHLGHYNITAFDQCLDIAGGVPTPKARVELNTCSGATSQRFAFDNFNRQYIYPAAAPELAIGVVRAQTSNFAPLELQTRADADYQNWRPVPVEHQDVGPKAPRIAFGKLRTVDHRNESDLVYYTPLILVRDEAALTATYEVFWKPLEGSEYARGLLSGVSTGTGQTLYRRLPEVKGGVFVAKARATMANGLFSESPEVIIDGRQLEPPSVWVQDVDDDEATVGWRSGGTPRVSHFQIEFRPPGGGQILTWEEAAKPGTGMANVPYQKRVGNLQPNTMYEVSVSVKSDLWSGNWAKTDTTTLPSPTSTDNGPFVTTIWMNREEVYEGPIPYVGTFGPIYGGGAVISNVNFPVQWPAVLLVKPGHSTADCNSDPDAVVLVHGDMTMDQKVDVWGTSDLSLSGYDVLNFVGCSTSATLLEMLPVNITWSRPQ